MELLMDMIMELVPDAVTELFSEGFLRMIRERVENPLLRKILYVLAVVALAALGVALACGILWLLGAFQ